MLLISLLADAAQTISADSAVSIGSVLVVGTVVVTAAWKVLKRIDRLEVQVYSIKKERDEDWRMKDQEIFALRLQLNNQHLKLIVPDPREISRGNAHRT